jgi:peptide/nickel transport system permease protein
MTPTPVLAIEKLTVTFGGAGRPAVDSISLNVARGEIAGIAGESGSGKSATALAILRLLPHRIGHIASGQIRLDGQDLAQLSERDMDKVRGRKLAYVPQEPMSALNPTLTIARQLTLGQRNHGLKSGPALQAAAAQLQAMGFPDPGRILASYPFQLSGGQRQRVLIAAAFLHDPLLLIADEPTTALDVSIQAEILDLLSARARERSTAVLLITHNLGVAWRYCDTLTVMRKGEIVERGDARAVLSSPAHAYTRGLIAALPGAGTPRRPLLPDASSPA